jgi:uridine kinase
MVRDSIYRNADAEKTLSMWQNVLSSEDIYLYPYKASADMAFDTFHLFELSVMKPFVLDLISEELAERNIYAGAVRAAMKRIVGASDATVPDDSLIREFLPGGKYEHLY